MAYETHPFLTIYRINSLQWNSVDQVTYLNAVKKCERLLKNLYSFFNQIFFSFLSKTSWHAQLFVYNIFLQFCRLYRFYINTISMFMISLFYMQVFRLPAQFGVLLSVSHYLGSTVDLIAYMLLKYFTEHSYFLRWRFGIHLTIDEFSKFVPCLSLTYNSSFAYHETHGQFQRVIESFCRHMTHNFTRVIQSTFQYGILFTSIKLLVGYSFLSQIFRLMENSGILNHESDVDIMCLHYVATPLIQGCN